MLPTRTTLAAAAAAALSAAALVAATSGSAAAPAPENPAKIRMRLVERQAGERFVDTGKHGLSAGDRNIVRSELLSPRGTVVGRADIDCVITGVGPALGGVCTGVLTLPDGQLVGEFAFDRSGSNRTQAITGGTGRYAHMSGEAIVDTSGSDSHEPFTIELTR
jgi:hypothetical protein